MKQRMQLFGALLLASLAFLTMLIGQPTASDRAARFKDELTKQLESREFHIDPAELLELTYNTKSRLRLIDVRSEVDYNLFHITDAIRMELADLDSNFVKEHPKDAYTVIMSNDEEKAEQAYLLLKGQGVLNLYILEGGINLWLDVFNDGKYERIFSPKGLDDLMRHDFDSALGDRHPASRPAQSQIALRKYSKKVKIKQVGPVVKGGCG